MTPGQAQKDYTPAELATKRRNLALDYQQKMKELAEIKQRKALAILPLLDEHGSAKKAELYYAATVDGQKEIELTFVTKGLLELMRSVKTECDLKNAEAYGQY